MAKRYTQEEKEYMAKMAIKIIKELDKDYPSFKSYVWASIVSANLLTMARKQLV